MGKHRREQSQDSIFVDNPFVDGFLEWMGSREGRQCIEVRDVLWDLLERRGARRQATPTDLARRRTVRSRSIKRDRELVTLDLNPRILKIRFLRI
jgi:hypothetical protein